MTPRVQGMVTITHPSLYPSSDYSVNSGAAVYQPDIYRTCTSGFGSAVLWLSLGTFHTLPDFKESVRNKESR